MANKNNSGGLGKGFLELLDDNAEITNMRSNVLLHKDDGKSVKIYDKTGGEREEKPATRIVIKK